MIRPRLRKWSAQEMGAATQPARRPSAGAVPGRWRASLAVRTSPAAAFKKQFWCWLSDSLYSFL